MYAANEIGDFEGKSSGALSAFKIDPKNGELQFLNQQPTNGAYPCYVNIDRTGKLVFAANYGGGSITIFPILKDGKLGEAADIIKHEGASINSARQEAPHVHSLMISSDNRYAYAADLGIDKIMAYKIDLTNENLLPNKQPWIKVTPGAGPRHFDFHPNHKFAYVINELNNTITSFTFDEESGELKEIQEITTLPKDFNDTNHTADIHVHPSGKFLYGSNRGHNSIAAFSIDENTGKLTLIAHESTQGKTPRNFAIDPDGNFLLAANQDTDTIVTFKIDEKTGELKATGHITKVPTPVCLKIVTL